MRKFFERRAVRAIGVRALLVVVVTLLFLLLNWYIAPTKPSHKKDLVLALAQILGGTALLSGIYFTWRTLQVNREGQITERFTRAIDQLGKTDDKGDKQFEIRIGGIYALERIARDSEEDHWPIMEVLTAYVRQHAPWPPKEGQGGKADVAIEEKSVEDTSEESETTEGATSDPDPDIQAIMAVLRRRTRYYEHGEPDRLILSDTNLSRADLWRANLTNTLLWNVNLSEANLNEATLSNAVCARAVLLGAFLRYATLLEAILVQADVTGADLTGADRSNADLVGANLSGADLSGAKLSNTEHLTQGQIESALGNQYTKLPDYLERPAHWSTKTAE